MVSKSISVVLFISVLVALIFSTTNILDPRFLFLSDNPITGGIRLAIVASLLAVSFSERVLKPPFRIFMKAFSIFLVVFGTASFFTNSMGWALYNYVMPLDSLLMINAGIVFGLVLLNSVNTTQKTPPKLSKKPTKATA